MEFRKHLILEKESAKDALLKLNTLAADAILFVVDQDDKLIGSLTDGDLRRGFIKGLGFSESLLSFIEPSPVFIRKGEYTLEDLESYKNRNLKIIPIIDEEYRVIDILNLRLKASLLPVDVILMAGGRGKRLMPLTANCPKPLLKVGDKPIIEHNIERLVKFGVEHIYISINYLGHMLEEYFGNGNSRQVNISYVKEDQPMGTIGSAKLIGQFDKEDILIMNSDLLTNIDFKDFYTTFIASGADMAVAATVYTVDVPYAIMEVENDNRVTSLKEKPRYTFYSNAGIYLIKKKLLKLIPVEGAFDITDLMDKLIGNGQKIVSYPILGYWLDIGKTQDYYKAQEDIKHIIF